MNNQLNISIIQSKIIWESPEENRNWFASRMDQITGNTNIIVLPEMFTTGFTMNATRWAESTSGPTLEWMHAKADKFQAAIVGSIIVKEGSVFHNRLIWMLPNGTFFSYDKRHLFRMAGEDKHYTAGKSRLVLEYKGWRICPLICYDLRFPVWSRNRYQNNDFEYDLLLYIANWPEKRAHAWKSLLVARAIENQSYVIGVNRIGSDANGINYSGDSAVLDYVGEKISRTERYGDRVELVTLNLAALQDFRTQFPVGLDSDNFNITV